MKVLFWGLIISCLGLFLHLLIWKIRIPKGQISALLKIFIITLVTALFILGYSGKITAAPDYIHIGLFVISLALAYITTFPALEVDSPSLLIILEIAKSGSGGLEETKLKNLLNDDLLVKPRIEDLVNDRLIYQDKSQYRITPRGVLLTRIFIVYRRILRAPKGG